MEDEQDVEDEEKELEECLIELKEFEENNNRVSESEINKEPEADKVERAVSRSTSNMEIISEDLVDSQFEEKLLVNMPEKVEVISCLASDISDVPDVEIISHQIIDNIIENAVALVEGFRAVQDNIILLSLTDVLQSEDDEMCVDGFNVRDNIDNQIRQESNFTKESGNKYFYS